MKQKIKTTKSPADPISSSGLIDQNKFCKYLISSLFISSRSSPQLSQIN